MMTRALNDNLSLDSEDLVEAALVLLVRLEDAATEDREGELSAWRARSPAHAKALDQATAEWKLFADLTPQPLSRLERMQLAGQTAWASAVDHPARTSLGLCVLLALALTPLYLGNLLTQPAGALDLVEMKTVSQHEAVQKQDAVRYVTTRGEQKHVSLPDGSSLWLNWNSEVLVAELEDEVHVDVLRGDALFTVSDVSDRPLVVHAGDTLAHGPQTEFAIHSHSPQDAFFQVKEGVVTIVSTDSEEKVLLGTAEQAYFENGKGTAPRPTSLSSIAAWREGKLIFDQRQLIDVLYELSHYTEQPLEVGHVLNHGDRISATFNLADADHALLQIADQYRLEVANLASDGMVVRSIRSGGF